LPADDHAAFTNVPLLPFPDASAVDDPCPSSNPYAATRFGVLASPDRGYAMTAATARPTKR
jgi:hypothetical protein